MNKIIDVLKNIFKNKSMRYGSNAVIMTAVVIAIAIVVNILVGMADLKFDLTSNKLYSIGDTTKTILSEVQKDVEIIGFFDKNKDVQYKDATQLLEKYEAYPRINVKYIDPDKNPTLLKQYDPDGTKNITRYNFVVKCGDKLKILDYYDMFETQTDTSTLQTYTTGSKAEQSFTGAIKYVTSDYTPVVYYIQGHGEYDMSYDMSEIKGYIERNNYEVKSLNLLTSDKIPDDAELLFVASPKKDLTPVEADKMAKYLKDGGKAIFMFDPLENDPQFPEFEKVLAEYNLGLNYDKVKETDSNRHYPDDEYTIILDVKRSAVVPQAFPMILGGSRSVTILKNKKDWITTSSLISTSDKAVGVQIDQSRGSDNEGPLDIAVSSVNQGYQKESKVIVMGNASFMTNENLTQYGAYSQYGQTFFLYSLNWMMDQKDEVIVESKNYDTTQLTISAQQAATIGIGVAVLIPLMILAAGTAVFLRRRHL